MPQAYWQSAIAAKPSAAHMGYLLGGLMWFCIPFTLATTLGLSALALDLPISIAESNAGAAILIASPHTLNPKPACYLPFSHIDMLGPVPLQLFPGLDAM